MLAREEKYEVLAGMKAAEYQDRRAVSTQLAGTNIVELSDSGIPVIHEMDDRKKMF